VCGKYRGEKGEENKENHQIKVTEEIIKEEK